MTYLPFDLLTPLHWVDNCKIKMAEQQIAYNTTDNKMTAVLVESWCSVNKDKKMKTEAWVFAEV